MIMKRLLITLMALALSGILLGAQSPTLRLEVSGKSMKQCLDEISSSTGVVFSYDLRIVDIPVNTRGVISGTLPEVLDALFNRTGIKW